MAELTVEAIPAGSLCVLDTNVLLYAEQGASRQAQALLQRIAQADIRAVLPQPVWQELMHKLMLAEALMLGHIAGSNPARQLAAKPAVVKRLSLYRQKLDALMQIGIGFEPCSRADLLDRAVSLQALYGFLTNDSLIAAVALRLQADVLVSSDLRFRTLDGIAVVAPSDLRMS